MYRPRNYYFIRAILNFIMAVIMIFGGPIFSLFNETIEFLEGLFWGILLGILFVIIGLINYSIYHNDKSVEESLVKDNVRLKKALKGNKDYKYKMRVSDDE